MRRSSLVSARAALGWGLFCFVALQMAFNVVLDWHCPGVYDEEFGVRLEKFRACRKEHPEAPTLLMLGSSRCVMNFLPEELTELRTRDGATVLPFNFSHLGAGPVMNLMQYRRLRRCGVRPDYLVVEVMPPCLSNEPLSAITVCATAPDLPTLQGYFEPSRLYGPFLQRRLIPCYRTRGEVLNLAAPGLAPANQSVERKPITLGPLGGDCGWVKRYTVTPEYKRQLLAVTRGDYEPPLHNFRITAAATRAYDELLEECRHDHVAVVLLLTPEGDAFRSWYPPEALARLDAWCNDLRRRHGVPIIDARRWLPEEDFVDSHHVWQAGAAAFTRRLEGEVLRPLIEGSAAEIALAHQAEGR
jgi:hypothetical protein